MDRLRIEYEVNIIRNQVDFYLINDELSTSNYISVLNPKEDGTYSFEMQSIGGFILPSFSVSDKEFKALYEKMQNQFGRASRDIQALIDSLNRQIGHLQRENERLLNHVLNQNEVLLEQITESQVAESPEKPHIGVESMMKYPGR